MSIELIPAIIPFELGLAYSQIKEIGGFSRVMQLDIGDGIFTPKATLQAKDFTAEHFSGMSVELHAMVQNPFSLCDDWISLGVRRMVIHAECLPSAQALQTLHQKGVTLVLGLNAKTPLKALDPYLHLVSSFLFLTIDPPGHQGGNLLPSSLSKVKEFHAKFPAFEITVDGGANRETITSIAEAGANRIVAGSALQENGSFSEKKYISLQSLVRD